MEAQDQGQVSNAAADVYETFFVPALFGEWPPRLADAASLKPGDRVLDVACGTGIVAREAARRVGETGSVAGVDRNPGMLAVARREAPGIDWREGLAEDLPFDEGSFDAALCQFGLMFFDDRVAALKEMARVVRPGGRIVVAVWDSLDRTPGYAAVTGLLQRLFGDEVAGAMRAPFVLGEPEDVMALFADAGLSSADLMTIEGRARFASIDAWVHTDVKGWTLADMIDDTQYELLQAEARKALASFAGSDGAVSFTSPAHLVTAEKP
jgi:SAM-dependent methyltransferase